MALTKVQINLGTTGNLSGSRSLSSGSFASRITTAETELTNTILSSSVQIGTDISGSFGGQRVGTTDSPTFNAITVGTATVTGTLTAQEIHSEFESASILFTSGSTHFGNSSDDIHNMTGSLNVSGGLSVKDGTLTVTDNVDFNGDLDVDGTTNLDVVDIDGAVDMASTLAIGGNITLSKTADNTSAKLQVQGDFNNTTIQGASGNAGGLIVLRNTDSTNENFSAINFQDANENTLSGILGINKHHTNNQGELVFFVRGDLHSDGDEAMRITHGGKVGIGTNNPAKVFHVESSVSSDFVSRIRNSHSSGEALNIKTNNTNSVFRLLHAENSDGRVFTIFNDAKVLIGNNDGFSAASASLHIAQNEPNIILQDMNHAPNSSCAINANSSTAGLEIGADVQNKYNYTIISFQIDGTERMRLDSTSRLFLSNGGGNYNTLLGQDAGNSVGGSAEYNTLIGHGAGSSINSALQNTLVGYQTGDALVGAGSGQGSFNVAMGVNTLGAMTTGQQNTAIGNGALGSSTSGNYNVAIGQGCLTGGDGTPQYNVAAGHNALNATGGAAVSEVVAIGRDAGGDINDADSNGTVAVGAFALGMLTSGQANTAVGWAALYNGMDVGDFNTAVGYQALYNLNPGSDGHGSNTAVGYRAGYNQTTAENNTFLGARAGEDCTGASNVIIGREAALDGTSISHNVIIGASAGSHASMTGDTNVFIGSSAGDANTNGTNNIVIGGGSDGGATQDYQITIGSQFNNDGDDNSIQFVNGALSRRLSYDLDSGNATITSDERTKEDITDYQIGLEFINKLKPKQFTKKKNADLPAEFFGEYTAHRNDTTKNPRVYQGMIAQEVSSSMVEMGITPTHITGSSVSNPHFSGWEQSKESGEQRLSYVSFVTPLIQSVKELTDEIRFLRGAITGSTDLNQLKSLISSSQFV